MKEGNSIKKELVHLMTAGSVDDGKSTLIGRLLYDSDQIYDDQLKIVAKKEKIEGEIDFSLFTDGLEAEREQKITIDVAYRYFETKKRRFIVADVPGHAQYTPNMVTGASHAEVALLLVDVTEKFSEQSKRHLFVTSLLGVKHVIIIINKMDVIKYNKHKFEKLKTACINFATKLNISDIQFIPVSALKGDMVVKRGNNLPWYNGRTVIDSLENIEIGGDRNLIDLRLPIQYVVKSDKNFRGYAGLLESGVIHVGDNITALPSGQVSKIKEIYVGNKKTRYAFHPQSVLVTLEDKIDVGRGDMVVRIKNHPESSTNIEAMICWFSDISLDVNKRYHIKHTTKDTFGTIKKVEYKINIRNLHRIKAKTLSFNDIGRVELETYEPLLFDTYAKNKFTGSFIIINEKDNNTVGAGIIIQKGNKKKKEKKKRGAVIWFTGLSGSGKSTIANALQKKIQEQGIKNERLDGDMLRERITSNLDFTKAGRQKNIEIAGYISEILAKHGVIVIASFISPYRDARAKLRENIGNFIEVYVDTEFSICEKRDVKGLYKKARAGEIKFFTGISDDYEIPKKPEIILDTAKKDVDNCVNIIIDYLKNKEII